MDRLLEIKDLNTGYIHWVALECQVDHPEYKDMTTDEWKIKSYELAQDRFITFHPECVDNYEVLGDISDPIMQLKKYRGYIIYYSKTEDEGYTCWVYKENEEDNLLDEFVILKRHITPYQAGRNLKSSIQSYMDDFIKEVE